MAQPTLLTRVLNALRMAGDRGLCVADVPIDVGYTLRNRLSELRAGGHHIEARPCRAHRHRGGVLRYRLLPTPPPGEQQGLPIALTRAPMHRDPTFGATAR